MQIEHKKGSFDVLCDNYRYLCRLLGLLEQSTILGIVALKANQLVRINNHINMHYAVRRIID